MIDERTTWNDCIDQLVDGIDTLLMTFTAARDNFNSRRIGRYTDVLYEIMDDLKGMRHDD